MNGRLPSFRGIEAFLFLVETGGIRAAARAMNLSVSAVSHRIRTLESEVGTPLFERGAQTLKLTPSAEIFHQDLIPISEALIAATRKLTRAKNVSRLKVTAPDVLISSWLGRRLGDWRRRMPATQLDIQRAGSETEAADITIRISFDDLVLPGEVKLFEWALTPVCRPDVVEEFALKVPSDLARAPLIDVNRPLGAWRTWFAHVGLPEDFGQCSLVVDSHDLMLDAVSGGLGIAIGAIPMMEEYHGRGLVAPFDIACPFRGGALVSGRKPGEPPVADIFRKWLIEEAAKG